MSGASRSPTPRDLRRGGVGRNTHGTMEAVTANSRSGARRVTWAARFVVLAVFLDLFMQFPTIAPYAESLGASAAVAGIAVAAYSFTNLFGNLGAGPLLDRLGRRGPMLVGMAVSAAAVLAYSVVQSPGQLMAARAIHGLGAAVLAPGAFSIIGDSAPDDRRGQAMGFTRRAHRHGGAGRPARGRHPARRVRHNRRLPRRRRHTARGDGRVRSGDARRSGNLALAAAVRYGGCAGAALAKGCAVVGVRRSLLPYP